MEMLEDLGPFPTTDIKKAASDLLATGPYETDAIYASLLFIGESFASDLPSQAPQRTWDVHIRFIHRRFGAYRNIKTDHEQWDSVGKTLWNIFASAKDEERFVREVMDACS